MCPPKDRKGTGGAPNNGVPTADNIALGGTNDLKNTTRSSLVKSLGFARSSVATPVNATQGDLVSSRLGFG